MLFLVFSFYVVAKFDSLPVYRLFFYLNCRFCITGKYVVRLFWLGAWRKVYVDDYLPIDKSGNILLPTLDLPKSIPISDLNETVAKSSKMTGKPKKGKFKNYDHIICLNYVTFADCLRFTFCSQN